MNKQLWDSILQFDLDYPISEYGFTTRLANENFWTKKFTEDAITEYKKFMYLASISEFMVSPSAIVDTVWHQHLIFTQSYNDFCNLLGKQIQHIPSTHNRNEFEKFKQAKERTTKLYNDVFGGQPEEIWEYTDMYDSLELPKSKFKIRSFVLIGILFFVAMIIPFYYLLEPIYAHIKNPDFVIGFIAISTLTFIALEIFNRDYLFRNIRKFKKFTFISKLHPNELVYLKTQNLSYVIHATINRLVNNNKITVNKDYTIEYTSKSIPNDIEEYQVLDILYNLGKTKYATLVGQLSTKPVFVNFASCMNALKKYYMKSKVFGNLFYVNFTILVSLVMIGTVRLITGFSLNKPVTQIIIVLLILTSIIIGYLWRLTTLFCNLIIPKFYKKDILPTINPEDNIQWQYFLLGTAALTPSFIPLVNHLDRNNNSSGDYGTSSCGSSCGSSCSSCGGCGGGD